MKWIAVKVVNKVLRVGLCVRSQHRRALQIFVNAAAFHGDKENAIRRWYSNYAVVRMRPHKGWVAEWLCSGLQLR